VNSLAVDRCLLSAIIVNADKCSPGHGFDKSGIDEGFTDSVSIFQHHVFDHLAN